MSEIEDEVKFSMTLRLHEIAGMTSDVVVFVIQASFFCVLELFSWLSKVLKAQQKPKSVAGKLALITGAGRGLGREIALKLAQLGCRIVVVDISEAEVKSVAEEIRHLGIDARSYKTDITDNDEVEKLKETVMMEMGQVDLLICNAGLIPDQAEDEVSVDFLKKLVEVNVFGTILVIKIFLEAMKRNNSGHIVAISSMSAICPSPFCVEYSATKAAINCYMKALGEKLRINKFDKKIHTTCICPFYITSRKDVVNFLNPKIRVKPLSVEEATERTVDAILNNETLATIPSYLCSLMNAVNFMPLKVQQLWRDFIMRENDFKSRPRRED